MAGQATGKRTGVSRRKAAGLYLTDDPLWYKDAVIYELHIRAFFDSNGDGVGDIPGLIAKLDYLQEMGITAIWLLPFYPSPMRDDGYDIATYKGILPAYGDRHDFERLVREAHRRGLRIITELVLNHTSDQHPWFQRARNAPPGSRDRNFYVWSDTPEKYHDARVIFVDSETSNWAWDPIAKSYYWHRFYSHQPDLNYDSAAVRREMTRVVDYWLGLGVDGLRLDAVPYLYEREGTNCENLPETHAFVKELRRHVDARFRNRMLLAEANQWPEDAAAYFGSGDEFNMAFHFPLMPRMFMAIQMEDRFPIMDILQQTPPVPATAQWATFLRNHDELTLEMVTDEDRDYMYRVYAQNPVARLNLGIRRRLAPLLNNNRRKIELMKGLLFSLPGTPVIYYGDEIGMGDNFYLGDRNGVRTPMQWSADHNAGFSTANPQQLYLPLIIDPEYHYERVNVELAQRNPESLLWWMKRLIATNRRYRAFGRGGIDFLYPNNRKVLAFIRSDDGEAVLVVANLARTAQSVHLDLARYAGRAPVELFGGEEFAPIGNAPYPVTLGPYGFYWFALEAPHAQAMAPRLLATETSLLVPEVPVAGEALLTRENWGLLEPVLRNYIISRRWFRGKARTVQGIAITDIIPARLPGVRAYLVLARVEYTEGEPETYLVPLTFNAPDKLTEVVNSYPQAIIARSTPREGTAGLIYDASVNPDFARGLVAAIGRRRRFTGQGGEARGLPTRFFHSIYGDGETPLPTHLVPAEQSNTSVVLGDRLILKLFRRVEDGLNPDLEVGRFLSEKARFPYVPPVAGAVEYHRAAGGVASLALLQGVVRNEGTAWQYTLDALTRYLEQAFTHPTILTPPVPPRSFTGGAGVPGFVQGAIGTYIESVRLLGRRTAEMHAALASQPGDPAFAPDPFTLQYQSSLYYSLRNFTVQTFQLLRQRLVDLPESVRGEAEAALARERDIIARYQRLRSPKISAARTRTHGDYHLGQVLYTGKDFVIIDFEGEPARPLSQRRRKSSPLRDVAGMLRSFDYAVNAALTRHLTTRPRPEDRLILEQWAQFWYFWVSAAFFQAYREALAPAWLLPEKPETVRILLEALLLDKAVYEVSYELNNRPDWLPIPLRGIRSLLRVEGQVT